MDISLTIHDVWNQFGFIITPENDMAANDMVMGIFSNFLQFLCLGAQSQRHNNDTNTTEWRMLTCFHYWVEFFWARGENHKNLSKK